MNAKARAHRTYLLLMAVALLGVILFFGLRPKDLTLTNNVSWLTDENGIRFRKYGIAFSPALTATGSDSILEDSGFSIELAVKPKVPPSENFSILLALDNGDDSQQLIVGQWRSWLIFMNGDDYAHKKKIKRLAIDTKLLPSDGFLMTIVADTEGTILYANGKAAAFEKEVVLKMPPGNETRVIVGNSAYGMHSWLGDVYGLAIYNHRLTASAVESNYRQWTTGGSFGYALRAQPMAAYLFTEKEGDLARDHRGEAHLELPWKMKALRPQVLAPPWENFEFNTGFVVDVCLNFIAFIPFGFVLAALLREWGGAAKAYALPVAAGLCVLTSLFIEVSQSWMPSRSSVMLDLLTNSTGGWTGVLLSTKFSVRRLSASLKP